MGVAADQLMSAERHPDRLDDDPRALRPTQIAAMDERFRERRDQIKLLAPLHRLVSWAVNEDGVGEP